MAKKSSSLRRYELHTALESSRVDPVNGVIHGVSIITSGVQARGHDLQVDHTTLKQIKECAEKLGTVPVKWNHRTGADAVAGYLDNFRIEGEKLLGDWHLLKSHDRFQQAIEMATRMPKNVGLSAAFLGEDEMRDDTTFARCSELISVDLVAQPAANPNGLFEAKLGGSQQASVDSKGNGTMPKNIEQQAIQEQQPTLADVMASLTKINERLDAQEQFNAQVTEALAGDGNQGEDGFTIEELMAMSPEQLEATLEGAIQAGQITPEQAQGIWATCAANSDPGEEGDGNGEGSGELAGVGSADGGDSGAGGTALAALQKQVKMLSARFEREDRVKEDQETAHYFEQVEHTLEALATDNKKLKELNATLKTQNEAMRKALRTGIRPLSFSVEGAALNTNEKGEVHEFEKKVESYVKAGKSKAQAIRLAHKDDPECHQDYLRTLGQ